jgi:hypothetical protein
VTTTLQRVGFFRQMPHGEPSDPDVMSSLAETPGPDDEAVAAYLDAGQLYIATPTLVTDVLDGKTLIGPAHYLTDGRYAWPGDASYYVRTYHVRLPDDFIEYARANAWSVPQAIDLTALRL